MLTKITNNNFVREVTPYSYRSTLRSVRNSANRKPFENDEKCFLLHFKSSVRSWEI